MILNWINLHADDDVSSSYFLSLSSYHSYFEVKLI